MRLGATRSVGSIRPVGQVGVYQVGIGTIRSGQVSAARPVPQKPCLAETPAATGHVPLRALGRTGAVDRDDSHHLRKSFKDSIKAA